MLDYLQSGLARRFPRINIALEMVGLVILPLGTAVFFMMARQASQKITNPWVPEPIHSLVPYFTLFCMSIVVGGMMQNRIDSIRRSVRQIRAP